MVVQRIRVSFIDPDATDSDDSGDESRHIHGEKAAMKKEMIILVTTCTNNRSPTAHPSTSWPQPPPLPRMRGAVPRLTPNRRHRGVYERQPGRWAADFRSHRLKVRRWIGTFPSEEEAKAAYDAFERQLSLGVSVEAATLSPTRSIVLDESDQPEIGLSHQADGLSTMSSPSSMSSLTSSPPSAAVVTCHKPLLPCADERQMMEDPFLDEALAHDDLIGLVDLADLPLPSLDDKLDLSSGDWSLLMEKF